MVGDKPVDNQLRVSTLYLWPSSWPSNGNGGLSISAVLETSRRADSGSDGSTKPAPRGPVGSYRRSPRTERAQ